MSKPNDPAPTSLMTPTAPAVQLDLIELPAEQHAALEHLLGGKSITETARSTGLSRSTIYYWFREDPVFQAAYNQWHDQMEQSCRSRLLILAEKAADVVAANLATADGPTAMQLLKGLGLISPLKPRLTDVVEIAEQNEIDRQRRATKRECDLRQCATDQAASKTQLRECKRRSKKMIHVERVSNRLGAFGAPDQDQTRSKVKFISDPKTATSKAISNLIGKLP